MPPILRREWKECFLMVPTAIFIFHGQSWCGKASGKLTQLAGKSTIFFRMYFLLDFGGFPCLPGLVYWGACQPLTTAPSPSLTAPITTRQHLHISKPPRKDTPRIGKVRMMCSVHLTSFFFSEKSWCFLLKGGGNPEDSQTIKSYGPCVKEFLGQHMKSGKKHLDLRMQYSKLLIWMSVAWHLQNLHNIVFIFCQILWRDIGVSIHNRTTAVKLSLSPDYGVHRDLVARLGPTTASASATF